MLIVVSMYAENVPVKILFIILVVFFFFNVVNFSLFSDQVTVSDNKGLCYICD